MKPIFTSNKNHWMKTLQWLVQIRERAADRLRHDWNRPGDWTAGNHAETWRSLKSQPSLLFPGEFPRESLLVLVEEQDSKPGAAVKVQSGSPADHACSVSHEVRALGMRIKLPRDLCATEKWRLMGWESQWYVQGDKDTQPLCTASSGCGRKGEAQHLNKGQGTAVSSWFNVCTVKIKLERNCLELISTPSLYFLAFLHFLWCKFSRLYRSDESKDNIKKAS